MGICVSYDHVLQLTSDIDNGDCEWFVRDGLVCSPKMRSGLFTTAAVDNIDYNPSYASVFHGTGISLMQHLSHVFVEHDRGVVIINQTTSSTKSVAPLPSKYTNVPPAALKTKQFTVPAVGGPKKPINMHIVEQAKEKEFEWLKTVIEALKKHQLEKADWISWSA